ncbi:hypothetical protein PR048_031695 [Dryococelus australis]|uniref:Uncharacterized protein n=1 Tax=Dryococelus australis TaxID=614101 RepID=A0ABQ9G607_9NEOP|nr:hypothetical protein PR048_031695 [Dryococelus australis]
MYGHVCDAKFIASQPQEVKPAFFYASSDVRSTVERTLANKRLRYDLQVPLGTTQTLHQGYDGRNPICWSMLPRSMLEVALNMAAVLQITPFVLKTAPAARVLILSAALCFRHLALIAPGKARATVAERFVCSPPTKANRVQSPAESPDFRKWESFRTMPSVSGFSRGSPVPPAPSLHRVALSLAAALRCVALSGGALFTGCVAAEREGGGNPTTVRFIMTALFAEPLLACMSYAPAREKRVSARKARTAKMFPYVPNSAASRDLSFNLRRYSWAREEDRFRKLVSNDLTIDETLSLPILSRIMTDTQQRKTAYSCFCKNLSMTVNPEPHSRGLYSVPTDCQGSGVCPVTSQARAMERGAMLLASRARKDIRNTFIIGIR